MSKFVSFSNINQTNKFKSKKNIIKGSYIKKIQFQKYRIKGQLCIIKRLYNRNIKLTNSGNFELEIINFYTLKDLFTNPISSLEVEN